jgi:tryptophanyl-tRNA synthetase
VVTPFQVSCTSDTGLDYARLASENHLTPVSDFVKAKFTDDKWVSRGIYFAEQGGLTQLLQEGKPFYVSLAKSPQAQGLHLGHMITFEMARKI